jgi:hypothetical protein
MLLNHPTRVASNASGDLVFLEQMAVPGKRLIHITSEGHVTAHHGLEVDEGHETLALGPDRRAYYLGQDAGIRRLDLDNSQDLEIANVGYLEDLVHDGFDRLYGSRGDWCSSPCQILRIDPDSSKTEVVAEDLCGMLAVDGRKRVFVARRDCPGPYSGTSLLSIELASGEIASYPNVPSFGYSEWSEPGLAFDPAGFLYFTKGVPSTVHGVVIETGEVVDVIGRVGSEGIQLGPLPASLNNPVDITLLPDGSLAIADFVENVVVVAK